ncbi:hypothetical protein RIF23_17825 [Lipingzhangella sp. LS1_29]|uniref:Uncharacterized protein n=1 Tax=Lipingzhangella rawalii TaxID=2055835 RepID=A0ABU2HA20_9ACTN|nr:hypothetical protein [Lipingzhangella rawalii]MDS1272152.1 hypothetical protein [Lipingzhangella rawalii]
MGILIAITGILLLVCALGWLTAVSLGMRLDDRRGAYGAIRADSERGTLARVGRRVVGLHVAED